MAVTATADMMVAKAATADTTETAAARAMAVRMAARTVAMVAAHLACPAEAPTATAEPRDECRMAGALASVPLQVGATAREGIHRAGRPTITRRNQSAVLSNMAADSSSCRVVRAMATQHLSTSTAATMVVSTAGLRESMVRVPASEEATRSPIAHPGPAIATEVVRTAMAVLPA